MEKNMERKTVRDRDIKTFAPGDNDILEKDATREEEKKGKFTRVTRLALDEVDPS
ncbi:MAG: hypothetical protein ACOY30_07945 [Bacillota bacterium]